ncbi:hypothetical protein Taro_054030 [Colocasia esculenta]|uniref:Glutaredoxin domain-containing protein n=1 Tax=Colocasia esculenta TaxID=4460 RepID=A0A843XMT8_COLES|nr:hypothetical protein [Colocasia esculenta]
MGCASSKRVEAAAVADVYRPPPTSVAVFDINAIEEPWVISVSTAGGDAGQPDLEKKPTHLPLPILEKLDTFELAPHSCKPKAAAPSPSPLPNPPPSAPATRSSAPSLPDGIRPVSQNSFLLKDREEREKKNAANPEDPVRRWRRNPLEGLPELCPPGGADGVVLYTTTLRGVRRTFEDCERARQLVEAHCMEAGVDERDVSLHGEYLRELRELVGEEATVPRLFVKGRYVGGVDEVVEMNETGRLRLMLRLVRGEGSGAGRRGCGSCGGARFVPCTECGGSCKVVAEDGKSTKRCGQCNENGLVQCPHCH